jgi:hypothetical protein
MELGEMLWASRRRASDPDVFEATRLFEDAGLEVEHLDMLLKAAEKRFEIAQIGLDEAETIYDSKVENEKPVAPVQQCDCHNGSPPIL